MVAKKSISRKHTRSKNLTNPGRETLQSYGFNLTISKPSRTDKDYKTNEETMKVKIMVNNNDESMSSLN